MSGRSGTRVAAHTPLVTLAAQPGAWAVSVAQARVLRRAIAEDGATFVRGAEVKVARALVSLQLGELTDDGRCIEADGKVDGERWTFKVNPLVAVRS